MLLLNTFYEMRLSQHSHYISQIFYLQEQVQYHFTQASERLYRALSSGKSCLPTVTNPRKRNELQEPILTRAIKQLQTDETRFCYDQNV